MSSADEVGPSQSSNSREEFIMLLANAFDNTLTVVVILGVLIWGAVKLFNMIDSEGIVGKALKAKLINTMMRWLK